jgi:isoquinoline 1-oxidoreductase beta subunit
MNTTKTKLDRRSFIKFSALAGGGLLVGVYAEPEIFAQRGGGPGAAPAPVNPNVYITVHPDNTFTLIAKNPETGQGMRNALPMIIADELDVDWKQVKVQQADCNPALYGQQIEGGSTATPTNYTPMRQIGAAARMMMVSTAAKQWNVPESECTTGSGMVKHARTNKSATYASLADAAMKMPAMAVTDIKLKDPKDFKIMGTRVPGVDNAAIVTGKPAFSIDVNPDPGMLFAVYQKCPTFGGKVMSANVEEVKKAPGVKHVFVIEPPPPPAAGQRGGAPGGNVTWAGGVAIVAETWWHAQNLATKS